jgi:hypothetical protein
MGKSVTNSVKDWEKGALKVLEKGATAEYKCSFKKFFMSNGDFPGCKERCAGTIRRYLLKRKGWKCGRGDK